MSLPIQGNQYFARVENFAGINFQTISTSEVTTSDLSVSDRTLHGPIEEYEVKAYSPTSLVSAVPAKFNTGASLASGVNPVILPTGAVVTQIYAFSPAGVQDNDATLDVSLGTSAAYGTVILSKNIWAAATPVPILYTLGAALTGVAANVVTTNNYLWITVTNTTQAVVVYVRYVVPL